MHYTISLRQEDPEWDEPGYVTVSPAGPWPPDYDSVVADFVPSAPLESTSLGTVGAARRVASVAARLRLGHLYIFFADMSGDSHVARYINGTSASPLIALDPAALERLPSWDQAHETEASLLHELGHAYLDSAGRSTHDMREEEAVEHFARTGDFQALFDHS